MLSAFLFTRETGISNPRELRSGQLGHQYATLVRSDHRYFPTRHSGIINVLAIEQINHRFMVAGGSDAKITIWDLASRQGQRHRYVMTGTVAGRKQSRQHGHNYGVSSLTWWPFDTGMFITGSHDQTVKVWDAPSLTEAYTFELGARVNAHAVSDVAHHVGLVACGVDAAAIRLLDLRSSSAAHMLQGHEGVSVNAVKWSPVNEFVLASGGSDGTVRVWDVRRSNACLTVLDMEKTGGSRFGGQGHGRSQAFSSSSSSFLGEIKSHRGVVNGLTWLENGKKLISTGTDEMIRVWNLTGSLDSGTNGLINFGPLVRNRYLNNVSLVLSPIGDCVPQLLFSPSDNGEILVSQVHDGKLVRRLAGSVTMRKRVAGLASRGPDHVEIFSGNSDGDIILWEPAIEKRPSSLKRKAADNESSRKPNVLTEVYKSLDVQF
ncbi:WD40-repeat-containing domain protein [Lipomyces japonicus]|uniref:WD40-repeat-containing domain protein n=1 Tax=Lipomyces japonicus TaxID=56871 RepID=UPI0034CD9B7D